MKQRRRFSVELKRQVIEELLSGVSSPAQLMRHHEISSGLTLPLERAICPGAL